MKRPQPNGNKNGLAKIQRLSSPKPANTPPRPSPEPAWPPFKPKHPMGRQLRDLPSVWNDLAETIGIDPAGSGLEHPSDDLVQLLLQAMKTYG